MKFIIIVQEHVRETSRDLVKRMGMWMLIVSLMLFFFLFTSSARGSIFRN